MTGQGKHKEENEKESGRIRKIRLCLDWFTDSMVEQDIHHFMCRGGDCLAERRARMTEYCTEGSTRYFLFLMYILLIT